MLEQVRSLEREIGALKGRLASAQGGDLAAQAVDVKGLKVLAARLDGADAKTLRDTLDKLKDKLKTAVVVLAAVSLAWFGGVAWGLGLPRFADTLHRAGPWIDVVSGAVFLVLATVIIAEGVASL